MKDCASIYDQTYVAPNETKRVRREHNILYVFSSMLSLYEDMIDICVCVCVCACACACARACVRACAVHGLCVYYGCVCIVCFLGIVCCSYSM